MAVTISSQIHMYKKCWISQDTFWFWVQLPLFHKVHRNLTWFIIGAWFPWTQGYSWFGNLLQCKALSRWEKGPLVIGYLFTALTMLCLHHPFRSSSSQLLLHHGCSMDIAFTKAENSMPWVSCNLQQSLPGVSFGPSLAILPESMIQVSKSSGPQ